MGYPAGFRWRFRHLFYTVGRHENIDANGYISRRTRHGGMSSLARTQRLLLAVLLVWSGVASAQVATVADGVRARLRADASLAGAILAVLPSGMQVRLLEENGDYVRVSADEKNGWVARRLLTIGALPTESVAETGACPSVTAPVGEPEQARVRRDELALMREEQEKNTWRMIGTTAGVALASFLTGFWLKGEMFRQRYGWLRKRPASAWGGRNAKG